MRFRPFALAALSVLLVGVPLAAHAASIPFFGPIIPDAQNLCPGSWGLLLTVINNIISLLITLAIVFVAPLSIGYAGFLMVVNPTSAGDIEKGKGIIVNTIVGIVIALAAWLIVGALMNVLYSGKLPSWQSIIRGDTGPLCLTVASALNQTAAQTGVTGVDAGGNVFVDSSSLALCSDANSACSPAALQAAGLSDTQSKIMSCIAVTESSGNPSIPPYNIAHPGSNSTACGTFQITGTTWNGAASGSCSDFSSCTNAACNIQVAAKLVSENGYSSWTCANCNAKAAACVQKYGST